MYMHVYVYCIICTGTCIRVCVYTHICTCICLMVLEPMQVLRWYLDPSIMSKVSLALKAVASRRPSLWELTASAAQAHKLSKKCIPKGPKDPNMESVGFLYEKS